MNTLAPRALYLTCTPPLPRDFGNRNRVFQTFGFLKAAGFAVDMMLYPFDYDWERQIPAYAGELKQLVDMFVVVPHTRALHQPAEEEHHGIDEWWDVSLELHLRYLQARRSYALVFVNYVFFSKALEFFDRKCLKLLDTHDMMSGRKEMLAAHGVEPEFFYTTVERESEGLRRADVVLAIKDSEAADFRTMCESQVVSLPFRAAPVQVTRVPRAARAPLRIGFIGAENSVNVVNLRRFIKAFAPLERLYAPNLEIRVAGNVCKRLGDESHSWLKLLGRVEDVSAFYADLDVIFVPLAFSTGQKIKVAEALAYGMPIVATRNGFDGFMAHHPFHELETIREVALALINLAFEPEALPALAEASRHVDADIEQAVAGGFEAVRAAMGRRFERVVFIVDQPFWQRQTLGDELWWQAAEYISHRAPVVVLAVGAEGADKAILPPRVQAIDCEEVNLQRSIPSVIELLCAVCMRDDHEKELRRLGRLSVVSIGASADQAGIALRVNNEPEVSVVFPRFLPPGFGMTAVFEENTDSAGHAANAASFDILISDPTKTRLLIQDFGLESETCVRSNPLKDGLRTPIVSLGSALMRPTISIGTDLNYTNIVERICALRNLAHAHFPSDPPQEAVLASLAAKSDLVRSDFGWDKLWAASGSPD